MIGPFLPSFRTAKAVGARHYFTGQPCKRGHTSHRLTSTQQCSECGKIHCHNWMERNKDSEKIRWSKYRGENRDQYLEHMRRWNQNRPPAYNSWAAMIQRCTNPKNNRYKDYGGRGIAVCDRWLKSFEDFLADMGDRPSGTSIDRIENDGNYEPGNCRWATGVEQRRNRRDCA